MSHFPSSRSLHNIPANRSMIAQCKSCLFWGNRGTVAYTKSHDYWLEKQYMFSVDKIGSEVLISASAFYKLG